MGIWQDEMRYKNKLSRKGKGNRRNRRFVQLSRGDFQRVSCFEARHGMSGKPDRDVPIVTTATAEEMVKAFPDGEPIDTAPSQFRTLREVTLRDGTTVLREV